MAPRLSPFPPSELAMQVQITADGKMRKKSLNLHDCALKHLTQYDSRLEYSGPDDKRGEIVLKPIVRLFRQCEGGLTVETTSWEGKYNVTEVKDQNPIGK